MAQAIAHPLETKSLQQTYHKRDGTPLTVVNDLNLSVPAGQICGLVAPNGGGKTTVLNILAGLAPPTAGRISLNGYDLASERDTALGQVGAVLEGHPYVQTGLSVWENLVRSGSASSTERPLEARAEYLMRELGLYVWRDDLLGELSLGMQRSVAIARALIAEPPVLLLDEPTQYLDVLTARRVEAWVRQLAHEKGAAVLLGTRHPEVAETLCDRVIVLRQGRTVADHPLSEKSDLIQGEYYQIKIKRQVDRSRSTWLGGLALATEDGDTVLSCVMADQTALHSLLAKIRDLGIPLLSMKRVEPRLNTVLAYLMHAPLDELSNYKKD